MVVGDCMLFLLCERWHCLSEWLLFSSTCICCLCLCQHLVKSSFHHLPSIRGVVSCCLFAELWFTAGLNILSCVLRLSGFLFLWTFSFLIFCWVVLVVDGPVLDLVFYQNLCTAGIWPLCCMLLDFCLLSLQAQCLINVSGDAVVFVRESDLEAMSTQQPAVNCQTSCPGEVTTWRQKELNCVKFVVSIVCQHLHRWEPQWG